MTEAVKLQSVGGVQGDALNSYIERVEKLEEEKANIASDIRDVMAEAKGNGYDPKVMRQVIRLRKMDSADRAENDELVTLYMQAIGMI
jgi:uncharacterized protein (UPF0335 family)